ncbi:MAG TPA: class I SAM-dependent methyltransferase [Bacteroidetes bacterium]|nr:class I SAM-dependent methyltransferase [Bacteroidota bacterium]
MEQNNKFMEVKKYYNERYTDKARTSRRLDDYKVFINHLKIKDPLEKSLFDIACGQGLTLKNAEKKGLKTFGLDISKNALKEAKENVEKSQIVLCSGEDICFKTKSFDYITCLGSLEHFLDIPKAIFEMKRVAKPDATFCVLVPNNIHYRLDAKSKWGIKKIVGTKQKEMQEELHLYKEWRNILQENGLKILKVHKDLFFIRKKNPLKNVLFYLWLKLLPLKYSYQFIFICQIETKNIDI